MLPTVIREEIYHGILSNDIIGFHTRSYRRNFLQCCEDLLGLEVDHDGRRRACRRTARSGCGRIRCRSTPTPSRRVAGAAADAEFEAELLRRRRDHLILRVDRADLSQERAARLHRVRPVPRAAPRVPRAGHVHRPADAVTDRRAGVRGVPRADRGRGRGRQPPPRLARLDADPAEAARRPGGGRRRLQALRRADGQRDVRRHEPRRQGGPDGERARRRLDPVARTPARTRSSASSRCRSTRSTSSSSPTRSTPR